MPVAAAMGRDLDEAMILICITISFLLSLVVSHIKSPLLRKLFNTFGGLLISTYAYGLGIFWIIPYNMIAYICMLCIPRKYSHIVTISTTGLLLTLSNIIEMIDGETGFNVSTLAMITFVKQMMIAVNYRDGLGDYEFWMTSREKKYALKEIPSLF